LQPAAQAAGQSTGQRHQVFRHGGLLEQIKDRNWLVRVSATICQHWQKKNARQKELAVNGQTSLAAAA